jgi:nucleoid-associated protein YgaU
VSSAGYIRRNEMPDSRSQQQAARIRAAIEGQRAKVAKARERAGVIGERIEGLRQKIRELEERAGALRKVAAQGEAKVAELTERLRSVESGAPAKRPARKPAGGAARARVYVVKPGDSLGKIAKSVYGSPARWRDIFKANKDTLADPDSIQPGMKLRLPPG